MPKIMNNKTSASDLQAQIDKIGPWWEDIDFGPGIKTGAGRNKKILWRDYLSASIRPDEFMGQSVLDMGCNAGGNLLELSKQFPSRLVGIDAQPQFLAQAQFVKAHLVWTARSINTSLPQPRDGPTMGVN